MSFDRRVRHTIYDVMEDKGVFRLNPANPDARDKDGHPTYEGPVEFPMMLYHPEGAVIKSAGVPQSTAFGPIMTNVREEIISRVVKNAEELEEARKEGWHDHPSKAIQAAIDAGKRSGIAPPMSGAGRIRSLEGEIERLQKQIAGMSPNGMPSANPPKKSQ